MSDLSWPHHLILVGPMGAGKSSVGRTAAALLRLPFVDTDHLIENASGRSVTQIFAECGEEAFRNAETVALQRLLFIPDSVVATGGGAVLREQNWEYMNAAGLVIRLLVTAEEAARRTAYDVNRPLLAGEDRLERLRQILEERESWYARAPLVLDVGHRGVPDVAQEAVSIYQQWRGTL